MKKGLSRIFQVIKDAVFPARCMACRCLFLKKQDETQPDVIFDMPMEPSHKALFEMLMAPFLCEDCLREFMEIDSPLCPRCGQMFRERVSDDHLCGECLISPGKISFARAAGVYETSLMHMIRAFKYRGKTQAARPFGRLLFFLYCRHYTKGLRKGSPPDVIIPVPLHRRRFRQRGFNQAWLLVKEWPEFFRRLNQDNHPQVIKDGLVRHRFTKPQAGLDKKSRKTNIKGAFGLSKKLDVTGKHILLVDDVYTTGATAEECAAVLLKNGASTIDILTLSRTC